MSAPWPIFDHALSFDPSGDFDAFLKQAPAKWVVYLLTDEHDQPVQLLCVKNLRYSLKRRLGGEEMIGPSRRVNYREIIRKIHWRRVDSAFEADVVYLEAARAVFPRSYRGMVGFRPAWFIHVDPDHSFPRYVKTIDLSKNGVLLGPLEDKHAAHRLIELAEDSFDLCRYYNILCEAPRGKACAYKEMGKCPAPCDGSISMEHYRLMIERSALAVAQPADAVREHTLRMRQAAADLRFESAGKIKQLVEALSQLGKGPFRHVRCLEDFRFLSLQRGPRAGTVKLFLIKPGTVEEIAGLIAEPSEDLAALLRFVLHSGDQLRHAQVDEIGAERIGVVSHHLFTARNRQGVFLDLAQLEERMLLRAYRELMNQKTQEPDVETEGVMKELQAM